MSWAGISAEDMVAEVCNVVSLDRAKTAVQTEIIRFINKIASDYMFTEGDWPELISQNNTLAAIGSFSYDMLSEQSDFGRIIDKTVRAENRNLELKSKGYIDGVDPDHSRTGNPYWYAMNGYNLIIYPLHTGTVYYDYLALPDEIEYTTAAADISYNPKNHSVIVDGALWLAMRRYGKEEWQAQGNYFFSSIKKALKGRGVRAKPTATIPRKF